MEIFWSFVKAFVVGGLICVVGQALLQTTKLTNARILVLFVTAGVFLTAVGLYKPLVDFAGAGATVPLTGFGYSLAMGAIEAVNSYGILGALAGGVTRAAGIAAGLICFKPGQTLSHFRPHQRPGSSSPRPNPEESPSRMRGVFLTPSPHFRHFRVDESRGKVYHSNMNIIGGVGHVAGSFGNWRNEDGLCLGQ